MTNRLSIIVVVVLAQRRGASDFRPPFRKTFIFDFWTVFTFLFFVLFFEIKETIVCITYRGARVAKQRGYTRTRSA